MDRIARVVLGIGALGVILAWLRTPWGLLGLVPLVTGLVGFCPLYRLFGLSTRPIQGASFRQVETLDASSMIATGMGLGALAAVEIAVGSVCPICVVAAPALIAAGAVKRWRAHQPSGASEPAPTAEAETTVATSCCRADAVTDTLPRQRT